MKYVKRLSGIFLAVLGLAAGSCGPVLVSNTGTYRPPPALALVVLVDPAPGQLANELGQLADVIRTSAAPGESVVVMMLQPSYGQVYTVRSGDSLSSIATAHGLTLSDIEAANAQLGPVAGRNFSWIHPGEHVIIPNGAGQDPLLLVARAPAGPPPPQLVRLPQPASNPTDYQRAQYRHTVAADNAAAPPS